MHAARNKARDPSLFAPQATVGPFARKLTSFALCCYVISLFNRLQPNHKHNGKECCSVVSSRFFGGSVEVRDIPKNGCGGDDPDATPSNKASGWPYISLSILKFLNRCISVKTSLINTKLGGFVNLCVLFLTWGSIVTNPIIYTLIPSPSRFEIRQ